MAYLQSVDKKAKISLRTIVCLAARPGKPYDEDKSIKKCSKLPTMHDTGN